MVYGCDWYVHGGWGMLVENVLFIADEFERLIS